MDAATSYKLGIEAFKAGNIDAAIEELESSTQQENTNYKAFNYLGAAYAAKGRMNAAVGAFKTAQQLAPNVASICYNIGQALEADGVDGEAEYEYERALQIDPNYAKAQEALNSIKKRLHHV